METTPTPNTTLSHESQAAIRKMLLLLDALCGNNSLWKYEELERAMEQMFQGNFSVPSFSRPRLKLAYLIIRRQILHLLTLESSIQQEKEEWKKEREKLLKEKSELKEKAAQKEKNSPPATQWKGGVPRSGEVVILMPQGITHQLKGITPPKGKQLKINSPPISIEN